MPVKEQISTAILAIHNNTEASWAEENILNAVLPLLERLKAYENADLIERDKVLTVECLGHNGDHYDKIEQIPKFNPREESESNE